jgi:hypothetical protein
MRRTTHLLARSVIQRRPRKSHAPFAVWLLFKAQPERHNHAPSEKTSRDLFENPHHIIDRLVTEIFCPPLKSRSRLFNSNRVIDLL